MSGPDTPPSTVDPTGVLERYLKILDYKQHIGTIQWTVFALFCTASVAILAFSLTPETPLPRLLARMFGVAVYFLGFFLFLRYRRMNEIVCNCLVDIETPHGWDFQGRLNREFHDKGASTTTLLLTGGTVYSILAVVASLLSV
jgi:hypothetical protein